MALFILFTIFLLFSSSSTTDATSRRSLLIKYSDIEDACRAEGRDVIFDKETCVKVLRSDPKIVASKSLLDLAFNINDAGFASSTKTKAYIESLLKDPSKAFKGGLKECNDVYHSIVITFRDGKETIKKDPKTSNKDFLIAATKVLQRCLTALYENAVSDPILDNGNMLVPIYALSVNQVVDTINGQV